MASKSKSKQEEALQFLDDLDSISTNATTQGSSSSKDTIGTPPPTGSDADALAFIDEITRKSTESSPRSCVERPTSRSGTPTSRQRIERYKVGGALAPSYTRSNKADSKHPSQTEGSTEDPTQANRASTSWGWGSVWSSASAAIQQAKQVVDEQVKYLPKNEQARKWGEGVMEYAKTTQLEKLGADFKRVGLSTWSDILNVVAPPISEHEVIQIWLTHDMTGHDGIESLVYCAIARIMDQVEGGDLIVTRGNESQPKEDSTTRNLNTVDGYDAAMKLAMANIDDLMKNKADKTKQPESPAIHSPTTYSHIYFRIQPFFSTHAPPAPQQDDTQKLSAEQPSEIQLQFLLLLSDPKHEVIRYAVTQSLPSYWLDAWDKYEWVENLVAECLRVGVETVGQEYLVARMGWIRDGQQVTEAEGDANKESDLVVVDSKA